MHRLTITCFLVGFVGVNASRAHADKFSDDDLAALDKQQSWQELFSHLGDVPPAKRDAKWQRYLEHSSLGVLSSLGARASEATSFADAVTRQYPQIKSNKVFMAQRADIGIRGLDQCVTDQGEDSSRCADAFLAFVDADPGNTDLAWRAGVVLIRGDPASAIPFFKRALTTKNAKLCSADGVKIAVGITLGLSPTDPRVADAQTIASTLCWDALKSSLVDRFANSNSNENYRRNTCGFMRAKKDTLSALSLRECDALK